MKKQLKKFIKNQIGFKSDAVNTAIDKYFEIHPEKNMYVHETHNLSMQNGELYLEGDFGIIVWNCETLFLDLPHIIDYVYKSREATDKRIKAEIQAEITNRLVL